MAEHDGGNRGANSGNERRSHGGAFRGANNSGGQPRGFRDREGGGQPDRPRREGDGERRSFGDRDNRGERKPFGDRPRREGDGERRSFGDRDNRKPYGDRDNRGERKPFGDRPRREGDGERRSFGDRDNRGERKPFGDRPRREGDGERRSFGDRDNRKPYGDRDNRGERKPFGDRPRREGDGERRSFGDRDNRKPYGDRDNRKPFGDRPRREGDGERRSFGDRDNRDNRGPRQYGSDRAEPRPVRVPNAADLRSANRPDRERSPEIDEDVTGKELDRATQHQIKTLEGTSAEWVAKHLVMAGRLIDIEPELSFQHALAASRRGGRLAVVREAVGLTAYAAGHYGEALREFRTYRRISGSNVHLPVMADCERGLGRPDRALDVARSEEAKDLDAPGKVELAIVASGARSDLGQLDAAIAELEIPQLDINRAFSYSPRLFRAYANALTAAGREQEAVRWEKQAVVAENALGVGVDEEPEIMDLGWDQEEEEREEKERRRRLAAVPSASREPAPAAAAAAVPAAEAAGVAGAEAQEVRNELGDNADDADAATFESDDLESDEDSVEQDELDENQDENAQDKED